MMTRGAKSSSQGPPEHRAAGPPEGSRKRQPVARRNFDCGILLVLGWTLSVGMTTPAGAATNHWAFQPLSAPAIPAIANRERIQTTMDAFILEQLQRHGLTMAPPADRRTLLRRATYDLLGLPPTPEEITAFARDAEPDAFARVVERLLNSPHYGEQWGRHWLDVVRYADTAGENTDHPLPHAWRYRNWVIQAFNRDKPYDEFVQEQIAGDLLAARGPVEEFADKTVATGYLAIARRFGHDIDKDMHLTFEDTIDTLGKSILGLTIGCARCHNHKYDPISMRDYYGLYGIFQSTRFAYPGCEPNPKPRDLVPLLAPPERERLLQPFEAELRRLDADVSVAEARLASRRTNVDTAAWVTLGSGSLPANGTHAFGFGLGTPSAGASPWEVDMEPGEMLQLSILPGANHGADSTGLEMEIAEEAASGRVWNLPGDVLNDLHEGGAGAQHSDRYGSRRVWNFFDLVPAPTLFTEFTRDAAGTAGLQAWHGTEDVPSVFVNVRTQTIRFVTVTMPPRSFAVHPGPKGGVAVAWQSPVSGRVRVQGKISKIDPGGDGILWRLEKRRGLATALAEQRELVLAWNESRKRRDAWKAVKPAVPVAYGVAEGKVADARLQKRGDPADPGEFVPRKFLDLFGGSVVPGTNESGRLELARWLTAPENPLTARVMVNRIWQWHFGRGLVATPNDFGARGQPPTHPALLDYLAQRFIRSGWSVKALHREILLSATYQQASQVPAGSPNATPKPAPAGEAQTPAAPALWNGFPRRRLSAEELRDTLLAVTGQLDASPGQAHPFPPEEKWTFTQHNPFAAEYPTSKRSVYVMLKRNRRLPFFALFDGADPNASTAVREVTTVPTQALFFMNDPLVHEWSGKLAARILAAAATDSARVDFATQRVFGRPASPAEVEEATTFLREYAAGCAETREEQRTAQAWSAYARVLLGSDELLYLD